MKFSNPNMFYLIWLVILLFVFVVYGIRKRARIVNRFIAPSLVNTMIEGYSPYRQWLKGILMTLSLLFLVLALTGPLVGFRWEEVKEKGVDIMIALDCSRSMLATDIKPNRLEQAKREIVDLLNMMHSDRAGLVAFAGTSILQCPLTLDYSAFSIFLNALNPDYLPMGGSDISGALQTATNGFETDVDSEKAIIIITDGENTTGDPVVIATEAAKKGIRIFCVGVGQEDGAPIPDTDGSFKKDDEGRIIMSKVDDEGLRKIAAVGNGLYVKSVAGDMDLDQIYSGEIQKNMKKTTLHSGKTKVWENRFQWLLLPSVLLLIAHMLIADRKKIEKEISIEKGISIGLLALFFLVGDNLMMFNLIAPCVNSTAYAESASASVKKGIEAYEQDKYDDALKSFIDAQLERPEMPELYYNIGSAAYKKQDYESALNNFTRAKEISKDGKDQLLKDKSTFNLGNTKYRMGDLEGAVKEFDQIPQTSKLYNEAKENIEFVKKKIEEKKKQEEQNKQDKDNQNQDNKEDQEQNKQNQENNKDQDSQEQNRENQDKQGQDKSQEDKQQGDKNKSKQEQNKQDQDQQEQQQAQEQQKQYEEQKQAQQQSQNGESAKEKEGNQQSRQHLLNRLEDKPGSAMMPAYSEKPVLKDW
ncbi:MAG: VWA domain-containing protein [Desulfamplus sp.]|nr:VWA domain-containing protein [Desulfamplus sp.]